LAVLAIVFFCVCLGGVPEFENVIVCVAVIGVSLKIPYEIRDPIYGFIQLNELERKIVDHPVFQRLRRIRQLAFTDMVYPSAIYSRFEHSLGVMHLATLMYDSLLSKSKNVDLLKSELSYRAHELKKDRQLIRLAALLHDVGHPPLSHAGEKVMPNNNRGKKYRHEDYTAKIIREKFGGVIEEHPENKSNYNITAEEVASLIEGNKRVLGEKIFWRTLLSSQLDADRGDYLLRDAAHIGVKYGIYDYPRLINTISLERELEEKLEENKLVLGVDEGGWHVAEEFILARYLMFTQVYFHKTRRAYDHHLRCVLQSFLPDGTFPPPNEMDEFLEWDDWDIFHLIKKNAKVNNDCEAILNRKHVRKVYETPECPEVDDLEKLEDAKRVLNDLITFEDNSDKLWYNLGEEEIFIIEGNNIKPLSSYSKIVKHIGEIKQTRLYTEYGSRDRAKKMLRDYENKKRNRGEIPKDSGDNNISC